MLAARGAKLFLIARNEGALRSVCTEIRSGGGEAEYAVADVADKVELEAAAARAVEAFGGFDTWVNDAGAFIYGRLDVVPLEDQRRLFDVTYWGMVHGTLIAAERLKRTGGAIVNVGSVLGEIAIPYQGAYCASKFAIKGFTEAFRREVEAERQPISITLVKPAAINTPFTDHARNRMDSRGTRNPPAGLRSAPRGARHPPRLRAPGARSHHWRGWWDRSCAGQSAGSTRHGLGHGACRPCEHDNEESGRPGTARQPLRAERGLGGEQQPASPDAQDKPRAGGATQSESRSHRCGGHRRISPCGPVSA